MNKKIVAANWKMSPTTLAEAQDILERVEGHLGAFESGQNFTLVLCPPFVFLEEVSKYVETSNLAEKASLGAQDIAVDDSGAMTGEVSGPMLSRLGVRYVIIGHSERRWKMGESDEIVNRKLKAALRNELIPIVCIGEKTRDGVFKDFLREQVSATFDGLSVDEMGKCIIAYEPVWAISSNPGAKPDTPVSALESISVIKKILNTKYGILNTYLYGGSVNSGNARSFLSEGGIDGILVGSASVNKDEFAKILSISQEL